MNIRINETNHVGFTDSVLMDIGRFQDLPSWLVAIKNNTVAFRPLDCAVIDNQRFLWVVKAGQLAEDIDATIEKVRRLPAHYRNFPNDHTEITVNSFEKGLYFNTNSEFEVPDALSRE